MGYALNSQQLRERSLKEYLAERKARNPARTPSRTFVNSTQRDPYVPPHMGSARSDADQHFNYSSAPMAAQIRRV